jgi:exonuclease SbcC
MNPRLHSLSTVCLLKHYNQNYLFHDLRTDFTGANGVGKSIIADLFQIVFVGDARYIKFATEGIDPKKRKIEKLPYESGIGYAFFNIEVSEANFITVGAAILAQGNQNVKPFIITASIDLIRDKLDQHLFSQEQLLYCNDFLKQSREPYALDELAKKLPHERDLYIHYFDDQDKRNSYYAWLYNNGLLSINLVKEGNLKAYAKVIQSFSKSKSLDISSSNSLIDYLFEGDESDIKLEYDRQEQTIRKLLHQFRTTKVHIKDISDKQKDLRSLKQFDVDRKEAQYQLDLASVLSAKREKDKQQKEFNKVESDHLAKKARFSVLSSRVVKLSRLSENAHSIEQKAHNALTDLAGMQHMFTRFEELCDEESRFRDIQANGLIHEDPIDVTELLEKDARYYEENIQKSRAVLKRYDSIKSIEETRSKQLTWVNDKIQDLEDKAKKLVSFLNVLRENAENNLFSNALEMSESLTQAQQAALLHLRAVMLAKPQKADEGMRYTDSSTLIYNLEFTVDSENNGWWIKTGQLYEFVPETSVLFPDLSKESFNSLAQLTANLTQKYEELQQRKEIYKRLRDGIIPNDFSEYHFDSDLSDQTKIDGHRLAAQLCSAISLKIDELKVEKNKEARAIQSKKKLYGIIDEDLEYQALREKVTKRYAEVRNRYDNLGKCHSSEKSELLGLDANLPLLESERKRLTIELANAESKLAKLQSSFQADYPKVSLLDLSTADLTGSQQVDELDILFQRAAKTYFNEYNQIVGKYEETKDQRDISVTEQIKNQNFFFEILERALLGNRIRALDEITSYLEQLNVELLGITEELFTSLVKVFGRTEDYFDKYRELVKLVNDFFRGKLISNRFYFRIDFDPSQKLDIKWIEHLRKSIGGADVSKIAGEQSPDQFIEEFYVRISGNKKVDIQDLLNPKRYFVLKGRLTDENGKDIPGSTGESYTAIALLGIARLSIVQDGDRSGLRFMILEESATLDNVNFGLFPVIAKNYGYQIITMTPKPYSIGGDEGWFLHQLIPGKENTDINYPKVMSYFRTTKSQIELNSYLKERVK